MSHNNFRRLLSHLRSLICGRCVHSAQCTLQGAAVEGPQTQTVADAGSRNRAASVLSAQWLLHEADPPRCLRHVVGGAGVPHPIHRPQGLWPAEPSEASPWPNEEASGSGVAQAACHTWAEFQVKILSHKGHPDTGQFDVHALQQAQEPLCCHCPKRGIVDRTFDRACRERIHRRRLLRASARRLPRHGEQTHVHGVRSRRRLDSAAPRRLSVDGPPGRACLWALGGIGRAVRHQSFAGDRRYSHPFFSFCHGILYLPCVWLV